MNKIHLRETNSTDCELYFEVRNHPVNRSLSTNTQEIDLAAHQIWFSRKLLQRQNHYFTILLDQFPVGYVRLDHRIDNFREVSIALLPEFQGKKIGQSALILVTEMAKSNGLCPLLAYIKSENLSSVRIFNAAGFLKSEVKSEQILTFIFN